MGLWHGCPVILGRLPRSRSARSERSLRDIRNASSALALRASILGIGCSDHAGNADPESPFSGGLASRLSLG